MNNTQKSYIFKKEEVEKYERKRYRGLDQKIIDWREKKIVKKILDILPEKNLLITDIPCGYGRFSEIFKKRGFRLINSDLSFSMVSRARERNSSSKNFYIVSDLKKGIPLKSGEVDCVFCFRFFHHLHSSIERERILSEFSRISRKWVIISFYQTNKLHSFQRKIRKRLTKSKTKIKMISLDDFRHEAEKSKLKIVKIFPVLKGIHSQHIALLEKTNENPM
jgi:SAM-dependent methyltransferase